MTDLARKRSNKQSISAFTILVLCALAIGSLLPSCKPAEKNNEQPNVLFIVLDTTRADRLGLYGHNRPTTPFLDEWSKKALVFDDCQSVSSTTVPSHASMFTGQLPSSHLTDNGHPTLDDKHETLAEILGSNGYRTFLFSANPFISEDNNFDQGFETAEHPWSEQHIAQSADIIRSKIDPADESSELPRKIKSGRVENWAIKACGEVAEDALVSWLDRTEKNKPFFAFINYMEAHRPLLPPRRLREKFMTKAQVRRSYKTDVSWTRMWEYVFGLFDYRKEEEEAINLTYDAAVAELDEILESLITSLDDRGNLDNTIILITADHGEHLCEHHLLDHQYSLYQPLLKVPMILWHPKVKAGRNTDPVSNIDVFPTILALAGVGNNPNANEYAVSLTQTRPRRLLRSDYFSPPKKPISDVKRKKRNWNDKPFLRRLRSIVDGKYKLIWSSDESHELYDLQVDPGELHNLFQQEQEIATAILSRLLPVANEAAYQNKNGNGAQTASQLKRMRAHGYTGSENEVADTNGIDSGTNGIE